MAYHGYLSLAKRFLHEIAEPSLLEIGVDTGVSYLTLTTFLARTKKRFVSLGIDVKVQDSVAIMLNNLDLEVEQQAALIQENSLDVLPKLVESNVRFNLVLLDGDHNYHTVYNELNLLKPLLADESVIICDDYHGRWSERDLWYAERPGYEDVSQASKPVDTQKHGVKPAIDDWVSENPEWSIERPIEGEPVILVRK